MKAAYPTVEEKLIDFLNRCKLENSEVMLCPRCSVVFDKEASKVFFQNLRKEENGSVIIDQSSLLLRVIFLSSITFRPQIMLIKMVKEKFMFPVLFHLLKNGFVRLIKMCTMHGKNNIVKGSTSTVVSKNGANFYLKG